MGRGRGRRAEGVNAKKSGPVAPRHQVARQLKGRRGTTPGVPGSFAAPWASFSPSVQWESSSRFPRGASSGASAGKRSPAAPTGSMAASEAASRALTALPARPELPSCALRTLRARSPPRADISSPPYLKAPGSGRCLLWAGAPAGQTWASHAPSQRSQARRRPLAAPSDSWRRVGTRSLQFRCTWVLATQCPPLTLPIRPAPSARPAPGACVWMSVCV